MAQKTEHHGRTMLLIFLTAVAVVVTAVWFSMPGERRREKVIRAQQTNSVVPRCGATARDVQANQAYFWVVVCRDGKRWVCQHDRATQCAQE